MGEVAEEWRWLGEWRTALNEDDLEKVSEQGEQDAEVSWFGGRGVHFEGSGGVDMWFGNTPA
jgi:hypothetical protein